MKTCPRCGYEDPPSWRQRHSHGLFEEVCNFDDFEKMAPQLADQLRGAKTRAFDQNYVYRMIKTTLARRFGGGLVVRQPLAEWKAYGTRVEAQPPTEGRPSEREIPT